MWIAIFIVDNKYETSRPEKSSKCYTYHSNAIKNKNSKDCNKQKNFEHPIYLCLKCFDNVQTKMKHSLVNNNK